ncbi:rhomboid family intramembrane serine protease [Aestuariibacter sp. A3R04]|uniref:rhomboid family intramembrane serine protease n=1 Tax=Aestuariibacter sp. A3R04 TaxID=2841571 RepID=UPI001C08F54A|nr:rhomboid family intramembrane serine protease [Aestuariibacter sp. A3R04]MBU3021777.1 rhomboid family intramembrane serine protease [Aestuariibacter sp. A3R04]
MPLLKKQIRFLVALAAVLIVTEAINVFTGNGLNQFGLIPRELPSLPFIFTAPFLHGSPTHLMTNLLPLMLFIWLSMQWGNRTFWLTTLTIFLMGGLGVWLFGRHAVHIGASGMVYGYFGFLLLAGFRSKRVPYLIISVLVALLYGGMLFGILPTKAFVSFEYHLFGFIGGVIAAWAWVK